MIVAPAVDLKGGRCVQLVGGRPEEERVSLPDPVAVAKRWSDLGFLHLHVVDLDAALGSGENDRLIVEITQGTQAAVQVGGGIRTDEQVDALLATGVTRVVVGTRALDDPDWLNGLAERYPGRVLLALDTENGTVLRKGWTERTRHTIADFLPSLAETALGGILSTDVGREGRLGGIDRDACARVVRASPHPVWMSGGITTVEDLAFLEGIGAAGAVLGMALYAGSLEPHYVAARWGGPIGTTTHE